MSRLFRPYDPEQPLMMRCGCGGEHPPAEHASPASGAGVQGAWLHAPAIELGSPADAARHLAPPRLDAGADERHLVDFLVSRSEALAHGRAPAFPPEVRPGLDAATGLAPQVSPSERPPARVPLQRVV